MKQDNFLSNPTKPGGRPCQGAQNTGIKSKGNSAATSIHQIYSLMDAGSTAEAHQACQNQLELHPDNIELLFVLAGLLERQGQSGHAVAVYRRILELEPTLVEAAYNLGLLHQQLGEADTAEKCYRQVLAQAQMFSAAHNNLGVILMERGSLEPAAGCFEMVSRIEPHNADGHFNWGRCLYDLGRYDEAADRFRETVKLNPLESKAWHNLGLCCQKTGQYDQALEYLQAALDQSSQNSDLYFDIGNVFLDKGDIEKVLEWYRKGVKHCPENVERLENLAMLLQERGCFEEAADYFRRIIEQDPGHIRAHFNLSLLLLRSGHFEEGWQKYEWRLNQPEWSKFFPRMDHHTRWRGENFRSQTLLVTCEQGFGDSIQFIRYLPMVKSRGGQVILEAPAPLLPLFQTLPGVDRIRSLVPGSALKDDFDILTPLLSLPGIFKTRLSSIPEAGPYLFVDPGKLSRWQDHNAAGRVRIGIVWAGSKVHVNDRNRSCSLDHFMPLGRIPHLKFYSLQTEISASDLQSSRFPNDIVHWGDQFEDFSDTAAAISNLDLLITVDTAVAHLAGAMGHPVWLLLPYVSDWRWFADRNDSPWYPSMRLFRQKAPGDWSSVFEEVSSALYQFVNHRLLGHQDE